MSHSARFKIWDDGHCHKPTICDFCNGNTNEIEKIKEDNKRLLELVATLNMKLEKYNSKDSVYQKYKKLFMYKSYEEWKETFPKTIRKKKLDFLFSDPDTPVYMGTLTFDPAMFPILSNRVSQRNYIEKVVQKTLHHVQVQGCFELFKSGIVHAHIITLADHTEELRPYFTRSKKKDHPSVLFVEKTALDAFNYITKEATKDSDEPYNYFQTLEKNL